MVWHVTAGRHRLFVAASAVLAWALALGGCAEEGVQPMSDATESRSQAAASDKGPGTGRTEKATFAAGCFWGVEAAFRGVKGVTATTVGYTGGHFDNPTYEDVCSDRTGHAEAVLVAFDPDQVSYGQLLDVFWNCHDPTTADRQGPDVGSQYRSAIFYHDAAQRSAAEASKKALGASGRVAGPIVTQIVPAPTFWPAEDYHQQYLEKRGRASCHVGLKQADP